MAEEFPDNQNEENPRPIGDDLPDIVDEIKRRSEASEADKARRALINLRKDPHATAEEIRDAEVRWMELEQEAKED